MRLIFMLANFFFSLALLILFVSLCVCRLIRSAHWGSYKLSGCDMNLFVQYQLNGWKATPNLKRKSKRERERNSTVNIAIATPKGRSYEFDNAIFFLCSTTDSFFFHFDKYDHRCFRI